MGIVRSTPELPIVCFARSIHGEWHDVMKLEETGLGAPSIPADECAAALVSGPDGAANTRRNST
jgi:hypothetical protein